MADKRNPLAGLGGKSETPPDELAQQVRQQAEAEGPSVKCVVAATHQTPA